MGGEDAGPMLAQLKNEPVNVHVVAGIKGQLMTARMNGFAAGTAPWQTYVDPDDKIVPGIFEKIVKIIEQRKDVAWVACGECVGEQAYRPRDDRPLRVWDLHHLFTFRRDLASKTKRSILLLRGIEVQNAIEYACEHPRGVHLDECGYVWQREKGTISTDAAIPAIDSAALNRKLQALRVLL